MKRYAIFIRITVNTQKCLGYFSVSDAYALIRMLSEFNILSIYEVTDKYWKEITI